MIRRIRYNGRNALKIGKMFGIEIDPNNPKIIGVHLRIGDIIRKERGGLCSVDFSKEVQPKEEKE